MTTNNIKVCIISHAYIDKQQRDKFYILAKNKSLDLYLITPKQGIEYGNQSIKATKKENDHGITVLPHETVPKRALNTQVYRGLKKTLQELQPDIIQLEEEYWTNTAAQVVWLAKRYTKAKIILQSCENMYHDWENKEGTFYQKLRMKAFKKAQTYVFKNIDLLLDQEYYLTKAKTVAQQHGYVGKRIGLPQVGIDQKEISNNTNRKGILFAGRLEEEKGIEELLTAYQNRTLQETTLAIYGQGLKENLVRKATEEDSTIHWKKSVSRKELLKVLEQTELVIVPSRITPDWQEQFGRIIVEAIAKGAVVIGTATGSIPYILPKTLCCLEKSPACLTEKIDAYLGNNKKQEKAREKLQEIVKERFTNEIIAKETENIYTQVLNNNDE